ncbi:MAG TPA: alpha/beta hydrolase [Pseudolabrys sp.]|nr:alpha/beta hydrolase [Pseudolabrys sp.]
MSKIQVGDVSVQYSIVGRSDPVVLLHCTGGSGRQWNVIADALCARYQVLAPDLCGYGGTTHWPGHGSFNLAVETHLIHALIAKVGKPAHVVGHSFGGAVALQLALRHPEALRTLTLIEPAAFHLLRDGDELDDRAFREISDVATTIGSGLNCGDYRGAMRRFVDYWNGEGAWDALPQSQRAALASRIAKVALDFWSTLNDPARPRDLAELQVSALIISGEVSPLPARRICLHLVRTLPRAKLRTIAGGGHMLPDTHPGQLAALIAEHCGEGQADPLEHEFPFAARLSA